MKRTWLVVAAVALGVAALSLAALSLVSLTGMAQAQDRARPGDETVVGRSQEIPAGDALAESDGPAEADGLDLLLAADEAGGFGDDAMAAERGGMGRGGARMRRGPGAGGMGDLREKLNLTDEQRSRLADIRDRQARAAIPIQSDLRLAALDMRKLMRAERPDRRAIDQQIDRISGLRAQLHKSRVAGMLDARAVLTPAQQKLLREHRAGIGGWRGGGRMEMMDAPMNRPRR